MYSIVHNFRKILASTFVYTPATITGLLLISRLSGITSTSLCQTDLWDNWTSTLL